MSRMAAFVLMLTLSALAWVVFILGGVVGVVSRIGVLHCAR